MDAQSPLLPTLRAAIDRLIPADDFPSASQADVDGFILALFAGDRREDADQLESGLASLDAEARSEGGKSFAALSNALQDEILDRVERGVTHTAWAYPPMQFFRLLLNVTAEGYFHDPSGGGNRGTISWTMLGYDPGANRP